MSGGLLPAKLRDSVEIRSDVEFQLRILSPQDRRSVWTVLSDILKKTMFELGSVIRPMKTLLTGNGPLFSGVVIRAGLLVALKIWNGKIHLLRVLRLSFPKSFDNATKFLLEDITSVDGIMYRMTVFLSICSAQLSPYLQTIPKNTVEVLWDQGVYV